MGKWKVFGVMNNVTIKKIIVKLIDFPIDIYKGIIRV